MGLWVGRAGERLSPASRTLGPRCKRKSEDRAEEIERTVDQLYALGMGAWHTRRSFAMGSVQSAKKGIPFVLWSRSRYRRLLPKGIICRASSPCAGRRNIVKALIAGTTKHSTAFSSAMLENRSSWLSLRLAGIILYEASNSLRGDSA